MLVTLKSRAEFLRAAASGKKWVTPGFIVQMGQRNTQDQSIGVGYTATKKLGGAVVRNRAKRRLRAMAKEGMLKGGKAGCDYVLIARTHALQAEFSSLVNDLAWALRSLHKHD